MLIRVSLTTNYLLRDMLPAVKVYNLAQDFIHQVIKYAEDDHEQMFDMKQDETCAV